MIVATLAIRTGKTRAAGHDSAERGRWRRPWWRWPDSRGFTAGASSPPAAATHGHDPDMARERQTVQALRDYRTAPHNTLPGLVRCRP